jgi:UTP--glucose-1-phosphate uridylyltransferase
MSREYVGNMGEKGVNKVVIPAAGLGTRFLPMTKAQPKEMLPVVDRPVIQYVVEEAVQSGIDDILIITGRNKRSIEDHFDRCPELELKFDQDTWNVFANSLSELSSYPEIHYVRQRDQRGLGDAVLLAEKHCNGQPFVVLLGDTITIAPHGQATCTRQMIAAFERYERSIIAVEPVPDYKIKDYGIIDGYPIDENTYTITDIIEKPSIEAAPTNLGAIGCYLFTPDIFDLIRETEKGHGGEIQLTDAIRQLTDPIGLVTNCRRYDIGDKLGWMKAFMELSLLREEFKDDLHTFLIELIGEKNG